ncbi:MAG: metallophosphoesterase family protein [Bacteroidota bacterium]
MLIRRKEWSLFLVLLSIQVSAQVTRQPYLQMMTPTSVRIFWQTDHGAIGNVYYGTTVSTLTENIIESETEEIYHEVEIAGLIPNTKYYYSVDGSRNGTEDQYFITAPRVGNSTPVRMWVISDFGQTNSQQNERRDETVAQWKSFNNNNYHADIVLSLGDQTEDDSRYQLQHNYFNQLEDVFKNSPLFTVIGNHDNHDSVLNYLSTFALPANAEAGGIASGTEKYYAFDYANIHVVVLCTEISDDEEKNAQIEWLKEDLDHNKQDWLIVCVHRPFHSGGYHRSDIGQGAQERRTAWLSILEEHGVDLILQGHNHVYERSFLLDNLIGKTTTLTDANVINSGLGREDVDGAYRKKKNTTHQGTIFVEVPGGGVASESFEHYSIFPVHYNGYEFEGSLVVDVDGNRMDVKFLCNETDEKGSHIWDYFTIIKE